MDLFIAYSELWGKGIGTRVVKAMSDYLIHMLGATVVCADPGEENGRSVACWLKAGFIPIGKVAAVSYTHLDVYKRQTFQGSGR